MSGMQRHNDRTNNVKNADPDLTHMNQTWSRYGSNDLKNDIESHIAEKGVKVRKNSVKAIEHLITFSPEFSKLKKAKSDNGDYILRGNGSEVKSYFTDAIRWLKKTYGKENLVHFTVHFDEKTPHMHAYIVPVREKEVKWKNKGGEGMKIVSSLCARDYLGGKEKMKSMQDSFHESVKSHGLDRGQRGSLANHEHIQKYYDRVNQAQITGMKMDDFRSSQPSIQIDKPSLFENKDDWMEKQLISLNEQVMAEKKKAVSEFKQAFSGEIEKATESKNIQAQMSREISSLSYDLSKTKGEMVKSNLIAEKAIESLNKSKKNTSSLFFLSKKAIKGQDPEAIQKLMNHFDRQEIKQSKEIKTPKKGLGM